MPFEYALDVAPNTPYPLYMGWGLFADLHGQQVFQGPIRAYSGNAQSPGYTFAGDNRTGWYQPFANSLGASIAAILRFYVDEDGTAYLNTLGFEGKFLTDYLNADHTYQLPNRSGEIALRENTIRTEDADFVISVTDTYVRCSHASTDFTGTLPPATGSGCRITVKNVGVAVVTIAGDGSDTLDGDPDIDLNQYGRVIFVDAAPGEWDVI